MSHLIGQIKVGCMADLVFWDFDSFGARPNMIVKGGVIAWAQVSWHRHQFVSMWTMLIIRWEMQTLPSRLFSPSSVDPCGVSNLLQLFSTRSSGLAKHRWTMASLVAADIAPMLTKGRSDQKVRNQEAGRGSQELPQDLKEGHEA
jgi:hypothetical protein